MAAALGILAWATGPVCIHAQLSLDAKAWREDLRVLADYLPKRHPHLFAALKREEFEQDVKRLDERIPTLNSQQTFVEMLRLVARVKNGHTRITKRDPRGFPWRRYPLRLYLYRDGLFVQEAAPPYVNAVGGRVIKIGNATTEEAIRAVRDICAHDNEMQIKTWIPRWLVIPEVLRGLGLLDDMEQASFVVEQRGQQTRIDPVPLSIFDTEENWVAARDTSVQPPLWLKDPAMELIQNYKPLRSLEDSMLEVLLKDGMDAAIQHYRAFKADPRNAYVDSVFKLRLIGRRLMNVHRRFADAVAILQFNAAEHPESSEALFLLGDVYERIGDWKAAIAAYQTSLKLRPNNWELVDRLSILNEKQNLKTENEQQ